MHHHKTAISPWCHCVLYSIKIMIIIFTISTPLNRVFFCLVNVGACFHRKICLLSLIHIKIKITCLQALNAAYHKIGCDFGFVWVVSNDKRQRITHLCLRSAQKKKPLTFRQTDRQNDKRNQMKPINQTKN